MIPCGLLFALDTDAADIVISFTIIQGSLDEPTIAGMLGQGQYSSGYHPD